MIEELERAKQIFKKTFCFMQMQADAAKARGEELMEKEDMEFLLSVELPKQKFLTHDMKKYDSEGLFAAIEAAATKGVDGLRIVSSNIANNDVLKIHEMGYFVEFIGPGDIGDEIYFTEDALIKNRVCDFKNLFGSLASVAHFLKSP